MFKRLEQVCIEDKYAKENIRSFIIKDIGDNLKDLEIVLEIAILEYMSKDYYSSKNSRINHLRTLDTRTITKEILYAIVPTDKPTPIQTLASKLIKVLGYKDVFDSIKTAAELIAISAGVDLCDISVGNSILVKSNYSLNYETIAKIKRTKYLPPIVCIPEEVTNNVNGGYLTTSKGSLLGKAKHNKRISLDVINLANKNRFSLDEDMIKMKEISSKPLDTLDKRRNFEERVRSSEKVYEELIELGNEFSFSHGFDSRGRFYCHGYHVSYQANTFRRACISLINKEIIRN